MHIIKPLSHVSALTLAIVANSVNSRAFDFERDSSAADALQRAMLNSHNAARKDVGVPALFWDHNLANDARKYAIYLAKNNIFEHDPQKGVAVRQGENLWMGTRGAFSYAVMADGWISEKRFYKKGIFPNNSNSGKWTDVGHYTQIIWRSTTHVGCAVASNRQNDFLVCRYSPAGNYFDQDPINN